MTRSTFTKVFILSSISASGGFAQHRDVPRHEKRQPRYEPRTRNSAVVEAAQTIHKRNKNTRYVQDWTLGLQNLCEGDGRRGACCNTSVQLCPLP